MASRVATIAMDAAPRAEASEPAVSARLYRVVAAALALPFVFMLAYMVWPIDARLTGLSGMQAGQDFIAFYAAGRLAAAGQAAATYSTAAMQAAYAAVLAVRPTWTPWAYPPPVLALLRPLGGLEPVAALAAWMALTMAAAVAAAGIAARSWALAPLGLLAPATVVNLGFGQNGTVSAALFAAFCAGWSRVPALAGVALGLLAYKPQLAIVPGLLALALGAWRLVAGAALTVAVLAALSLAIDGSAPWPAWIDALSDQSRYVLDFRLPPKRMIGVFALVNVATGLPLLAAALHAVAALGALGIAFMTWRRSADPFARALTLTVAALVVPPYAFDYDAAILLVPLAALAAGGATAPALTVRGREWFLALCLMPLLCFLVMLFAEIQVMAPCLLALLFAAWAAGRPQPSRP